MGVAVGQEALGVYAALWSLLPLPGLVDPYSAGSEAQLGALAALAIDLPLLVLTSMLLRLLVRWWLGRSG